MPLWLKTTAASAPKSVHLCSQSHTFFKDCRTTLRTPEETMLRSGWRACIARQVSPLPAVPARHQRSFIARSRAVFRQRATLVMRIDALIASGCIGKSTSQPGGRGCFQSVKLQRPDRATVCSHSVQDATASMKSILCMLRSLKRSKSNVP